MSEQREAHRDTQDSPTPPRERMDGGLVPYGHSPVSSANEHFKAANSVLALAHYNYINSASTPEERTKRKSEVFASRFGGPPVILPQLSAKTIHCSDPASLEELRDYFDGIPVIKSDDPDLWLKITRPKSDIAAAFALYEPPNILPAGLFSGWTNDPPPTDSGDSTGGK